MQSNQEIKRRQREWIGTLCAQERLPSIYAEAVFRCIEPLSAIAAELREAKSRPVVMGISGAQGSGKSTLAVFLTHWLQREARLSTACLSLDDFYLGKRARRELAEKVHPLFATRGVPGTHDLHLALKVLRELTDINRRATIRLPRFDKASDDRVPKKDWPTISAPVDVIILEGWCVGARPQQAESLINPVNTLEKNDDPDGVWRRYVNDYLSADYCELFNFIDALIMLRIPSFDKVFDWRGEQEKKRIQKSTGEGFDELQLDRFIMHFERLTRHMLETMPRYADAIIEIDDRHRMSKITRYLRRHSNSNDAKF